MEAAPVSDAEYNLTTPGPPANGDGPSALTDAEVQRLILATLHGCEGGCTKAEAHTVVTWAHHVRMDSVLLDLILSGHVVVSVDRGGATDGEMRFRKATTAEQLQLHHAFSRTEGRAQ